MAGHFTLEAPNSLPASCSPACICERGTIAVFLTALNVAQSYERIFLSSSSRVRSAARRFKTSSMQRFSSQAPSLRHGQSCSAPDASQHLSQFPIVRARRGTVFPPANSVGVLSISARLDFPLDLSRSVLAQLSTLTADIYYYNSSTCSAHLS